MKSLPKLITSIVICELAGILGSAFTINSIPTWYATLNKPFFSPPNWIFGPVWTTLYLLMGISLYLIWTQKPTKKTKAALKFFAIQLGLNFIWTPIFFGLRAPLLALIIILALLYFILKTMGAFKPLSQTAFYLLAPTSPGSLSPPSSILPLSYSTNNVQ